MNDFFNFLEEYYYLGIIILVSFFVIKGLLRSNFKKHHSHWNTLLDNFSFSTQEFYNLLKEDLQDTGYKSSCH